MRLFVFGLGYSARAVVARMRPRLAAAWGTTRDPAKMDGIAALGVKPVLFGGEASSRELSSPGDPSPSPSPQGGGEHGASPPPLWGTAREGVAPSIGPADGEAVTGALAQADHVLVSIAPDESGDPVLGRFSAELAALNPQSVVYLSTVGVYGDHNGAWVDEASELRPVSQRSRQRVEAEAAWTRFGEETGVPVAIVRLAGIYGPGRGPFEKIRNGTARRIVKPGQVFNRIHADDIAAIVEAAFLRRAAGIFNGSDDEPAPPEEVLAHAASLLGAPPPPEVTYADAELSPMARSFYGESKRVLNGRIKAELGVRLAFPTYREGLAAVLAAERSGRHQP